MLRQHTAVGICCAPASSSSFPSTDLEVMRNNKNLKKEKEREKKTGRRGGSEILLWKTTRRQVKMGQHHPHTHTLHTCVCVSISVPHLVGRRTSQKKKKNKSQDMAWERQKGRVSLCVSIGITPPCRYTSHSYMYIHLVARVVVVEEETTFFYIFPTWQFYLILLKQVNSSFFGLNKMSEINSEFLAPPPMMKKSPFFCLFRFLLVGLDTDSLTSWAANLM